MDQTHLHWTRACRGVSKKLRKLRLGFWLNGHPNNLLDFHYLSEWSPILPETTARALKAAKNIVPSFMEQLGYQTDLRQLELSFNAAYRCGSSPFLKLAVRPANGLDQLSELHRLEDFSVTAMVHEVGSTEIDWMAHHWPRLMKLQLPILDTKDNTTLVSYCHTQNAEWTMPDYRRWFPSLHMVKVVVNLYSCYRCDRIPDTCSC